MTAHKKGAPDERSPGWVLTTRPHCGIVGLRGPTGVSLTTPSKMFNSTNSVRFNFPDPRPQGGLAVAVIRAHPGQNCIPTGPSESRVELTPRKWTRWGWTAGQDDEPLRTKVWDGLPLNNQLSMRVSQRLSLDGVLPNE